MKNKLLPILVFILVFAMSLGFILLFNSKNNKEEDTVIVKNVELLSTFPNGDKISINNFNSQFENIYTFSVNNSNEDTIGYYKVQLRVITPLSNTINNNFTYTLTSNTDSTDKTNVLISKESSNVPIASVNLGSATITPDTTHNYTLTLKYSGESLTDRIFVSQIEVIGEDK